LNEVDNRGRTFFVVCGLTLLPLAIGLPALYFLDSHSWTPERQHSSFGWLLCLISLLTIYCEFRALWEIEQKLSGKRDIFWFVRIPVGLVAACIFVVSVRTFVAIALPELIFGDIPALVTKVRGH